MSKAPQAEGVWAIYLVPLREWVMRQLMPPPPHDSVDADLIQIVDDMLHQMEKKPPAKRPLCLLCDTAPWRAEPFDPKTIYGCAVTMPANADPSEDIVSSCWMICHSCHEKAGDDASLKHAVARRCVHT